MSDSTARTYFEIGKTSPVYVGRWKLLSGSGRDALYRALCGVERNGNPCLGHLGDLAYFWPSQDVYNPGYESAEASLEYCEKVGIERCQEEMPYLRDRSPQEALDWLRGAERTYRAMTADSGAYEMRAGSKRPSAHGGWQLTADLLDIKRGRKGFGKGHVVYRGYADTGYYKHPCEREVRPGEASGRRPATGASASVFGSRWVQGQHVVPSCKIRCPACGEMNAVDWPKALADPRSR